MTNADDGAAPWFEWRFFWRWLAVNLAAFIVIPLAGIALEQYASAAAASFVDEHRILVILFIAVVGAAVQGTVLGRWQWRLLITRVPGLSRHRWVTATLVPAFAAWLVSIAPAAAEQLARGGETFVVFRNGFLQALVLGPLIGLAQANALRGHTSRWAWWLAANVTAYLVGALLHVLGTAVPAHLPLPTASSAFFPVPAIAIHGAWMLWVTAPQATGAARTVRPAPDGWPRSAPRDRRRPVRRAAGPRWRRDRRRRPGPGSRRS